LQGLTQLQRLDLQNTQISDAGLPHLRGFRRLRELDLTGTRVSPAAAAELRAALPKVRIGTTAG
jgi:Leucine-rich repeat (LRR) protein